MLAPDFATEISRASPGDNVTAILNWRAAAQPGTSPDEIARAKQVLIDELCRIEGVRINPLVGFPQLIVVAPAGVWKSFINRNAWLQNSDQVEVVGNSQVFRVMH
jgi:hypothetical protein